MNSDIHRQLHNLDLIQNLFLFLDFPAHVVPLTLSSGRFPEQGILPIGLKLSKKWQRHFTELSELSAQLNALLMSYLMLCLLRDCSQSSIFFKKWNLSQRGGRGSKPMSYFLSTGRRGVWKNDHKFLFFLNIELYEWSLRSLGHKHIMGFWNSCQSGVLFQFLTSLWGGKRKKRSRNIGSYQQKGVLKDSMSVAFSSCLELRRRGLTLWKSEKTVSNTYSSTVSYRDGSTQPIGQISPIWSGQ